MNPGRLRRVLKGLVPLGIGVLIVLTVRSSFADHYHVPTGSMRPTVAVGDRIIVDKTAYGLRIPLTDVLVTEFDGPERGHVVVLESPEDGEVLLKRVVAVPGDEVAVRDGRISIGGAPVSIERMRGLAIEDNGAQAHAIRLTLGGGPDMGPTAVPPGHYLVMGDNRGESHDGRSFGFVHRDALLGRAIGVFMRGGDFEWIEL